MGTETSRPMGEWKGGYGGARWLCALGLHPVPGKRSPDDLCPACGRVVTAVPTRYQTGTSEVPRA